MDVMESTSTPPVDPQKRLLQILAVVFHLFLAFGVSLVFFIIFIYLLLFTKYYWFCLLYIVFICYEGDIACRGGRRSAWVRSWGIWRHLRDFFPVKLVKTVDLDPNNNYILCAFPHGIFSFGICLSTASDAMGFSNMFEGITPYITTLHANFKMPLFREFLLAIGCCSASKDSLNYLLVSGSGRAVALVIGGVDESLKANPGMYRVTLKDRKGFVKIALRNGASLVPVFSFGETDLYSQWDNPKGSWLRWAQDLSVRFIGFAPMIAIGQFPFFPNRRPVTTVVGRPIDVKQVRDPTDDEINSLHRKFVDCLIELFEEEKHKYLEESQNATLVIE